MSRYDSRNNLPFNTYATIKGRWKFSNHFLITEVLSITITFYNFSIVTILKSYYYTSCGVIACVLFIYK